MKGLIPFGERVDRSLSQFRREMDTLFDRFFDKPFAPMRFETGEWMPAVDVAETDREIIVKVELPGLEVKDIDIALKGNLLTIKGERKQESEKQEESFHRKESSYGMFSRTIQLPAEVDEDKIEAVYKKGILKISLPKTGGSAGRKIEIK